MKLHHYYSLYDTYEKDLIINRLDVLQDEGKIIFSVEEDSDVLTIEDIELTEHEIEKLLDLFDKYDVYPYLERDDEDDEEFDDFIDYDEDDY